MDQAGLGAQISLQNVGLGDTTGQDLREQERRDIRYVVGYVAALLYWA